MAEVEVEDWSVTVEETTGARSSMQENLQGKDRGASTLCVTPASHRGEARLSKRILTRIGGAGGEKCDGRSQYYDVKQLSLIAGNSAFPIRFLPSCPQSPPVRRHTSFLFAMVSQHLVARAYAHRRAAWDNS